MDRKPKVLVAYKKIPCSALAILETTFDVVFHEGDDFATREELKTIIKGVDAIFWLQWNYVKIDRDLLDTAGPQLKAISQVCTGTECVDMELIKSRGIRFTTTQGLVHDCTANTAILLALSAGRRVLELRSVMLSGGWNQLPDWKFGYDLTASKVGIVGFGLIGQAIAKRIKAFEPSEIFYTSRSPKEQASNLGAKFLTFDRLIRDSDFIFICVPLTPQTNQMFSKREFEKMKPNCVLVNVSRGAVVNQEDLATALRERRIYSAGLDVTDPEPLPFGHELMCLPNCVITPHVSVHTHRLYKLTNEYCSRNLVSAFKKSDEPIVCSEELL